MSKTDTEKVSIKWIMIDFNHFIGFSNGYSININVPLWFIHYNGILIDSCYYHNHIPTGELDTKVSAERELNKIIQKNASRNNN